MSDLDGELSNVNPALLALCQDPEAWREQRRRAMREKIYGQKSQGDTSARANAQAENYMPLADSPEGGCPTTTASCTNNNTPRSQSERESYVLQQLMSRKRAREQAQQGPAQNEAPPSEPTPSMRDRILQKYKK